MTEPDWFEKPETDGHVTAIYKPQRVALTEDSEPMDGYVCWLKVIELGEPLGGEPGHAYGYGRTKSEAYEAALKWLNGALRQSQHIRRGHRARSRLSR